jgi:cysteine-S-conjugate beta-lyase
MQHRRNFSGSGTVFSFVFAGGDTARRTRFIESLNLFGIGWSWGGYESLVVPVDLADKRSAAALDRPGPIVRLQIGLEDVRDLIDDLTQALETV